MSRRPIRRGGGRIGGPSSDTRNTAVASSSHHSGRNSVASDIPGGSHDRSLQLQRDELDRVLEDVINFGGADADGSTPTGSYVSSSSSTNDKGVYKGLALEKENRSRGDRLEVEISSETGRPNLRHQAIALALEMGLACRECLPLSGDWRTVDVDLKQMAFERMNARLKLINLDDIVTYDFHLRHMGLIRRRWKWRVHREYMINGDDAKPAHTTDADWDKIKKYWATLDEQRERHSSDPMHEKRSLSEIGETARSQVVNLHCTGPIAHTTLREELERSLERPIGRIELFERTRRKDICTEERPDGWLPGTKATHDKFIQLQNDAQASGRLQTDDEIVDEVMNAANRSDCRPGIGYGPRAVGRSSKRPCSSHNLRSQLFASQRKNVELTQKVDMLEESHAKLEESHAKLAEEMAQIKVFLALSSQNTSRNIGDPSPSENPSTRADNI